MPIPKPEEHEQMAEFIDRCMSDEVMNEEYPKAEQRLAVCAKQWSKK
jgi:hypothetical protein